MFQFHKSNIFLFSTSVQEKKIIKKKISLIGFHCRNSILRTKAAQFKKKSSVFEKMDTVSVMLLVVLYY